ncbi:MAG: diaminopimelate epimerase, partial [Clostridia bacterium]|nr:diaminopimelate epimerase [Clostridia bacterium]
MKFAKYQGLGNDFVLLDSRTEKELPSQSEALSRLAQKLCDRRLGIGADGLLILRPSTQADFFMQII